MNRSDVVTLIKRTYTTDTIGQKVAQETEKTVFCKLRSVSGTEWFAGAQNHMKPQYEVNMFLWDYDGEEVVEYNGKRYGVYRTYAGKEDNISLYLEEKAGL